MKFSFIILVDVRIDCYSIILTFYQFNSLIYKRYLQHFPNKMQAEYKQFKYKQINIQNLQRKQQTAAKAVTVEGLVNLLDRPEKPSYGNKAKDPNKPNLTFEQKLYCYKDTAASNDRVMCRFNNFFNAFYTPYNQHGDVFLVPDDIWLMISMFFSKYMDQHAEKLRSHFVNHEGQKELTIVEYASTVQESLKMEKEWDFFFAEIIKQIKKNTVQGVVQALSCNFSTTDQVYKLISTSIVMSSLKKYFSYGRMIMMCGLDNIYFAGTRDDWVKVQQKLNYLIKYDVDGVLKKYITHVDQILKNFIETFDEKPNKKWWNTIMTSEQRQVGSGGQSDTYIQGWILHLYGIYDKVEVEQIPKTAISVPIKLVNQLTKTEKKLQLIADWVSVSKVNQTTYKPDIGMCIVERQRKQI